MQRAKAHRVVALLAALYASPRHDNKDDPLDELVFIVLSQMTTHWSFRRVYDRLKERYPSWKRVLEAGPRALMVVIGDAGLSRQKAPRIIEILRRLRTDFGRISLDAVRAMNDDAALRYLTSLPGVGAKTAKCVLMYSCGRSVLPVDTHVRRVASRLGLLPHGTPTSQVDAALERAVAPADRYAFHVNAIAHGRALCIAGEPRCHACPLTRICRYAMSRGRNHRPRPTRTSTPARAAQLKQ